MTPLARRVGWLWLSVLFCGLAHAEDVGSARPDASNADIVYGVSTVLPTAAGIVAIGGPALRRLPAGARRWQSLHVVPNDNLYRVATDEQGRLLAVWETESLIHFIDTASNQALSLRKPAAPAGVSNFQIADIAFAPNGHEAIVFMGGNVTVTTGQFHGPSPCNLIYRIAIDGSSAPILIDRFDHALRLQSSGWGGVFGMLRTPGRPCDARECGVATIVAVEITDAGISRKTLFTAGATQIARVRAVRSSDRRRVALLLDESTPVAVRLLRWGYGDAQARLLEKPLETGDDNAKFLLTRADNLYEFRVRDGLMEVWQHTPVGGKQIANVREMQSVDTGLYAIGERADGRLWWHWGDHIGVLAEGKAPESASLEGRLPRRSEWTGDVYVPSPDHLWLGIDDTGRHYVRVSFADLDKKLKPWPPGSFIERTHGEYAGYDAHDSSTNDRLNNATTLRPMVGGLFSIGGAALRRLPNGEHRWKTLLAIPKDNLYRVAADAQGRILAAWENDPNLHFFSPKNGHLTLPKPVPTPAGIGDFHVDHFEFLPNGREAYVTMEGEVKSPPSPQVKEPVRFYYSRASTAIYRLALDGNTPPKLMLRLDSAYRILDTNNGAVFVMPKYPGQQCTHETCMPIAAIVAYEFSGDDVRTHTLLKREDLPASIYPSQVQMVRGSDAQHMAMVMRLTKNEGKFWLNGGRTLLRWHAGDAKGELAPLPDTGSSQWLLARNDDFIELVEHWDDEPDTLEVRRHSMAGGQQSINLKAQRKMQTPYGLGERANGGLWVHWGDHLALFSPGQPPKSIDMDAIVQRGTEWAGAQTYVSEPESLWVGLDGRGRGYVRVDLTTAEKRAKVWR